MNNVKKNLFHIYFPNVVANILSERYLLENESFSTISDSSIVSLREAKMHLRFYNIVDIDQVFDALQLGVLFVKTLSI